MMRVGLFQPVHVKTLASQKRRALLAARKILQEKALAIENDIRGLLRNFGLKVGIVGVVGFEQRIHDLVEGVPELADIMEPLLAARRVLREKFAKLHRKVLLLARDNEVCQRLMTIPGVGPVVSLAFISTVDVPARFRNSKAVGPSLGLTPVLNQSGEGDRCGFGRDEADRRTDRRGHDHLVDKRADFGSRLLRDDEGPRTAAGKAQKSRRGRCVRMPQHSVAVTEKERHP